MLCSAYKRNHTLQIGGWNVRGKRPRASGGKRRDAQGWGAAGAEPDPRRWLILVVIAVAQLMVVLDATVMNIALPSAQTRRCTSATSTGSGS